VLSWILLVAYRHIFHSHGPRRFLLPANLMYCYVAPSLYRALSSASISYFSNLDIRFVLPLLFFEYNGVICGYSCTFDAIENRSIIISQGLGVTQRPGRSCCSFSFVILYALGRKWACDTGRSTTTKQLGLTQHRGLGNRDIKEVWKGLLFILDLIY
jgi:hypothetical protein